MYVVIVLPLLPLLLALLRMSWVILYVWRTALEPPGLIDFRVLVVEEHTYDFHILVELLASPLQCAHCSHAKLYRHEIKPQLFMDLPIRGKRVGISVQRRRYRCCACHQTFYEPLPHMNEGHFMTTRLVSYIQQEALRRTFVSIADEVGLTEGTVRVLFREFAADLQPRFPDNEFSTWALMNCICCISIAVFSPMFITIPSLICFGTEQCQPFSTIFTPCHQFAWLAQIIPEVSDAFLPFTLTIEHYGDAIFNYFTYRYTAGYTECLNGMMKLTQRMGRGYSFEAIRAKVLLTNGLQKMKRPGYGQWESEAISSMQY